MRDESIQEKARMTFIDHDTSITKICTIKPIAIQLAIDLDVSTQLPETLMQKSDMRMK